MILSNQSLFSNDQAVTATAVSTNVIDTGEKGTPTWGSVAFAGDIGKGTPIPLEVAITEDFATLTSLTIAVETGATDALGTVLLSQTVAVADLKAGKRLNFKVVPEGVNRYLGLRYTVTGTNATTGKIKAGISHGGGNNVQGV